MNEEARLIVALVRVLLQFALELAKASGGVTQADVDRIAAEAKSIVDKVKETE